MNNNIIITVASWEERFILGIEKTIAKEPNLRKIIVFFFEEYLKWSSKNIQDLEEIALEKDIKIEKKELSFSRPIDNWLAIREIVLELSEIDKPIVDFTTMPRSVIWYLLFFLKHKKFNVPYVYYKAGSYNKDWLSRNPDSPRLVYKMSGISHLGRPTLLFVFTGYDPERVEHLISFFEPREIEIIVQDGQDYQNEKYRKLYSELYKNMENCNVDAFNSFDIYKAEILINEKVSPYKETHNIIVASLGPKTSAIALFSYVSKNPEIGLCYVPSKEFNKEYSIGISSLIEGVISSE